MVTSTCPLSPRAKRATPLFEGGRVNWCWAAGCCLGDLLHDFFLLAASAVPLLSVPGHNIVKPSRSSPSTPTNKADKRSDRVKPSSWDGEYGRDAQTLSQLSLVWGGVVWSIIVGHQ